MSFQWIDIQAEDHRPMAPPDRDGVFDGPGGRYTVEQTDDPLIVRKVYIDRVIDALITDTSHRNRE